MDILYWLAAARLPGMGPVTLQRCLALFGDIKTLFCATAKEMSSRGLKPKLIALLQNPDWQAASRDLAWCKNENCQIITLLDPLYPKRLKEISNPPIVLYVQGSVELLNRKQIALVGSRHPSRQGQALAMEFASALAEAGLVVTSGLALGIDASSHEGALKASGLTIAVSGAGLSHVYPRSHRNLAQRIIQKGAFISEFPPDEMPKASHFPRRNRIISGLSVGVLVIEAALKSGSLITAELAADQGREVFAVPGSIHNPLSRGCHYLIRQGAKLVETAQDVLEEIGFCDNNIISTAEGIDASYPPDLSDKMRDIFDLIGVEMISMDAIIMHSGLTPSEVSSMLLGLELQGLVHSIPGGYARTS